MKYSYIAVASSLLCSCAALPAGSELVFTGKQSHYSKLSEKFLEWGSFTSDPYDSFRNLQITSSEGVAIDIAVPTDLPREKLRAPSIRALPFAFTCNFEDGRTSGSVYFSYQDPRNLYGRVLAKVKVECVPLTPSEIALQREQDKLAADRIAAEEKRKEEELAKQKALSVAAEEKRLRDEKIAEAERVAELARQKTPEYQREKAKKRVIYLRSELNRLNKLIEQEKRIASVSGYEDAAKLYGIGRDIIDIEDKLNQAWSEYKNHGGTESTLYDLK